MLDKVVSHNHAQTPADLSTFERTTYRKVTWRLIPFLFFHILSYVDRVVLLGSTSGFGVPAADCILVANEVVVGARFFERKGWWIKKPPNFTYTVTYTAYIRRLRPLTSLL